MNDFLAFRKMITPVIIQILFWIGVVGCVISGLVAIASGQVGGVIILLLGPVFVRIYCELLIVVFRMFDALQEIVKNTSKGAAPAAAPPASQPGIM